MSYVLIVPPFKGASLASPAQLFFLERRVACETRGRGPGYRLFEVQSCDLPRLRPAECSLRRAGQTGPRETIFTLATPALPLKFVYSSAMTLNTNYFNKVMVIID